ncbi:MAG TPA: arginine--tRNA ligase [Saprospiraceae bacterium]|nr:arginine--tRNA ligase [Saprospiraceae bacterium]HMQ85781.1 arginine--tRNA ligase [Saprospiraceae bacterium]
MMNIGEIIQQGVVEGVKRLYGAVVSIDQVAISTTRKEFEGDYTVVTFPFARLAGKKPDEIAQELGEYLQREVHEIARFNVVKGFLNLVVSDHFWVRFLESMYQNPQYGQHPAKGEKVMVEYSSPNTNKPLHLGHIRNILLGWSSVQLLQAAGYEVVKVQIVNDRGIAICKSMLAWQLFANGETPEKAGIKSDHLVGKYYVLFEKRFQEEYKNWQQSEAGVQVYAQWQQNEKNLQKANKWVEDEQKKAAEKGNDVAVLELTPDRYFFKEVYKNTYFNEYSSLGKAAKEMLLRWEAGDPDTLALWRQMNNWVYQGFDATYAKLGVTFDKIYYESNTYLLGKDTVDKGLAQGVFYQKEDGSAWIDLTDAKLDHKLLLRSDGTSVYMTQDLGTAQMRYQDFGAKRMVYVVGDEQNYHFQVLFEILKRLGEPYADGLFHLSYGMVDLPTGKMKSREGTVVDADDLIEEVIREARVNSEERANISDLEKAEQEQIIWSIGLAALKFFILKVQPKKRMLFDPKESVDMQGQTGPYVQNAFVRIRSVMRKAAQEPQAASGNYETLESIERELLGQVYAFPSLVATAAEELDPSTIANFCYDLAKNYHRFYHDYSILNAETEGAKAFRLRLSEAIGHTLQFGMALLGIEMPEKM